MARWGALIQSVLPGVLTTRLPSLPSKVLPVRLAPAVPALNTPVSIAAAVMATSGRLYRMVLLVAVRAPCPPPGHPEPVPVGTRLDTCWANGGGSPPGDDPPAARRLPALPSSR